MQYLKLTLSFHSQNQMPTQNQINLLLVIIYFSLQNSNETTYTVTLNVTYKQTNKWTKDFIKVYDLPIFKTISAFVLVTVTVILWQIVMVSPGMWKIMSLSPESLSHSSKTWVPGSLCNHTVNLNTDSKLWLQFTD